MKELLHTPEGVRDVYGKECRDKLVLENRLKECMHRHGYLDIETPTFEYFDIFSSERGTVPSKDMYKFFDREGNTLVLRPDMTPSIARSVAKYYRDEKEPIKLCYCGNTFINNESFQGRLKETTQLGAELMKDGSVEADASMIELTVDCLLAAGISRFQIEIGNADFFKGLMEDCAFSDEEEESLRKLMKTKNLYGASELLAGKSINPSDKELLLQIPELFGSFEKLSEIRALTTNKRSLKALDRLSKLYNLLKDRGYDRYVSLDLGMLSKYRYYTGIIFRAITYGSGEAVASGGRYDNLLGQFGMKAPAIGMSITVDALMMATTRQEIARVSKNEPKEEYITVALAKGRLAEKAMEILSAAGYSCEEMKDKTTRKLIFTNEEKKMRFFLAKANDVPTYVEYGAADVGIVGRDTILEEGRKLYEVIDFHMGKCKMCVAGPPAAADLLGSGKVIRVATKYPAIAKDYFLNVKHQTVEIIKLNGSIELAPIVGLSEVIVDIVETGSTLRENGLTVLEEVAPLSARMVVNQASMKMEEERIRKLIKDIRSVISE
ncbi:MAG: ATP phosphoribosyltransferase regulatory subunit [Lachnospiraceae bacterium]|nr:ATP phosphoribosyltransferase regulatory subunit [Lachnospiraceae bacterium]MBO4668530.1 ATP phosphoribosyltransferase regulatory subunit [Lachnospiraceae bacterium]